jgi:hypothetical protein
MLLTSRVFSLAGFLLSGLVLGEFSGLGFEMPVSGLR